MNTPRDITATALIIAVQIISAACLVCYIAGHPEWTAWLGGSQVAVITALCFSALAFALYLRRNP